MELQDWPPTDLELPSSNGYMNHGMRIDLRAWGNAVGVGRRYSDLEMAVRFGAVFSTFRITDSASGAAGRDRGGPRDHTQRPHAGSVIQADLVLSRANLWADADLEDQGLRLRWRGLLCHRSERAVRRVRTVERHRPR
jgi:hypothetical protein